MQTGLISVQSVTRSAGGRRRPVGGGEAATTIGPGGRLSETEAMVGYLPNKSWQKEINLIFYVPFFTTCSCSQSNVIVLCFRHYTTFDNLFR